MLRPILVAAAAVVFLTFPNASPTAAAEDISTSAASSYDVVPARGLVRVTVKEKVTNRIPNTTSSYDCSTSYYDYWYGWITVPKTCTSTTRFYLNEAYLWVEAAAKQLKVTSDAGSVKLTADKRTKDFRSYKLTFPKIFKGQTRTITARYVLRGGAPRSASTDRINGAYVNFWAMSQPTDKATVRVTIPKAFDIDTFGGSVSKSIKGNSRVLTSGDIPEPEKYIVAITGTNPKGLTEQRVSTSDGRNISILGWPGDKEWMAAVRGEVETSIPKLQTLIGQPLPGEGTIVVREVAGTELGDAYIASYDPSEQLALVSENFRQAGVVTHELSHAWFNDGLFDGRWLSEGYATWIERATGEVTDPCAAPNYPGTGTPDLGSWKYANPRATAQELSIVTYQYDAACAIVSKVAQQVGDDRMREILVVLNTTEGPYEGVSDARPGAAASWRDWLDAVDERGMRPAGLDDTNAVASMLVHYGIASQADLGQRAVTREALDELRETTAGWAVPVAVTRPLAQWSFQSAQTAITSAGEAFALAGEVERVLPSIDAASSPIRDLYERATDAQSLKAAHDQVADQLDAARLVANAIAIAQQEHGPIDELGLLGTDLPSISTSAIAGVSTMNLATATAAAQQIHATLEGATTSGILRIAAVLAVVALVVFVGWALRRRRRSGQMASAEVGAPVVGSASEAPGTPDSGGLEPRPAAAKPVEAEFRALDPP
jgi:hypothetical protein